MQQVPIKGTETEATKQIETVMIDEPEESGKLNIALLCLKGESGGVPFPAFDPAIDGV
jgi:hypothetical protein